MNDDASRRYEQFRGLHRLTGEQERNEALFSEDGGTTDPRGREQRTPADNRQTPEQRYAEAVAAMQRIVTTLDFEALPWVTEVFRATASALYENDPARASVLNNLGSASQLAYLRTHDTGDLQDAVSYYRAAASTAREDDRDLVLYLCNLALALTDHGMKTNNPELAEEAARTARQAAESTPRRDQRRVMALVRLGNALKLHARLTGDTASEDETIDVFRDAVRSTPSGASADAAELLINLGSALLRRYERRGAVEDLDEGISQLRTGVDGLADGEPRRLALCHLSNALRLRFQWIGDLNDLLSAINELLGLLGVLGARHQLLGKVVWNLSCTTVEHTDSTGEPVQLRRVLRTLPAAIQGLAPDDPDRAMALTGFGALLRRHFLHGAEASTLDTSIAASEAAAEAITAPARRCSVLNSLVTTLVTRYEHSGNAADLDRAAEVAREAAEIAPEGSTPQHTSWAQLGIIAAHRYRRHSRSTDLEMAIEMFDRALAAMPDSAPGRAAVATHLGRALQTLFQKTGRRRLYRWARKVLTDAAAQPTAPADQRLRAASLCGRLAAQAHRWSEALDSFTTAVELLPLVTRSKRVVASPTAQQRWALIAADAAACALETGQPERAVELLEHGRTAILADFLPTGGELGELHRQQPDLVDTAVRLRRLLDRPPEEPALADPVIEDERRRLVDSWEELLREVRAEPGHGNHLRLTPFSELAAAGSEGSVVLVNLSRYRSDALIVFAGRVLIVPLPGASPESAAEQATYALAATQRRDSQALADALDWLWHNITRPVLDRMGYVRPPQEGERWPRMWWSAIGALAFLPLHAATSKSGQSAMDRVISSYTPTLGALIRAKQRALPEGRALIAAGSTDRITRELPLQNQVLAQYWPGAEIVSLEGTSPAEMLRLLPQHPWVHICEPSTQYPAQPAAGLLLDREGPHRPLGLVELGQVALEQSEFAYLGQCATAVDTPSAAAVTLGEALGFAGFVHVISTLWDVAEDSAAQVLGEVYDELFGGNETATDRSAQALHAAAQRLRSEYPDQPARWAGYAHVGP